MSELHFLLYLHADDKFLKIRDVPHRTARAIYPEIEGESEIQTIKRAVCRDAHSDALKVAVGTGRVTPLNPISFVAEPGRTRESLEEALISREDFKRFAATVAIGVGIEDDEVENEFGYTINGAAKALAAKYELPINELREQIFDATKQVKLQVRNPRTGIPYVPESRRTFYERVRVPDLNAWLDASGLHYSLDSEFGTTEVQTGIAQSMTTTIDKTQVVLCFSVFPDLKRNKAFWKNRLSDPPKWLLVARISPGGANRSARWDPVLLAAALLGSEAHEARGAEQGYT